MADQLLTVRAARTGRSSLGDRVRQLRVARGLTQTELAGERFSKEYVSQIERGKTRPTGETIEWLAVRLGVDQSFLETGISSSERERAESTISRAEAALESSRFEEAVDELSKLAPSLAAVAAPDLEFRALLAEAWGRMYTGDLRRALDLLGRARVLAEGADFTDVDRAEVLFRLGSCRHKLNSISTAIALFTEAYDVATRSGLPADRLRSRILERRARCFQRQRDFEAAREDVERALELAQSMDDRRMIANVYFQASLVSERMGHLIASRNYAQQAKALYQELNDQRTVGRLMQNLGGLHLLLGKPEVAVEHLNASFALAVEADSKADAALALGNLATVYLHTGDYDAADDHARRGIALFEGREDFIQDIGQTNVVLGRSLMERGRLDEAEESFKVADQAFERLGSVSYRAGAWVALGDLASRRGDDREAARLYRNAAEALQDIRF